MLHVRIIVKITLCCVVGLFCASCGPHMNDQPSIKPYEREMPDLPGGTVPTNGRVVAFTLEQANLASNPLPQTPENLENGRIFYGYYCLMCHGSKGDGNGPVGESYVPKPSNLASDSVKGLSDGQLYYSMLYGVGHEPVMVQTVPREHRWPIVMYVRTFGASRP